MASERSVSDDLLNELVELRRKVSALEQENAALQRELATRNALQCALEHSANGVLLSNAEHQALYVNAVFSELTGLVSGRSIAKSSELQYASQTAHDAYDEMWQTIEAGSAWHGELCRSGDDDDNYWVFITVTPIFDAERRIVYFLSITEDIVARKQIEQGRHESEERYRALVETAPDIVAVHRGGVLIYANPAAVRILGATCLDQLLGLPIINFVHPDDRELVAQRTQDLISGVPIGLRELRYVRLDGQTIYVEFTAAVINYGGEPAILSVGRDVTEQHWIQDTLRITEARFRLLVESMQDTVFTLNREGRFTGIYGHFSNQSLGRYLGGLLSDVLGVKTPGIHEDAVRRALTDEHVVYEWAVTDINRARYYQTSLSPLRDEQGALTGLVGVVRDITSLKRAEEELDLERKRYEMAQRAANIGVWDWDVPTGELHVSELVEPMFGHAGGSFDGTFASFLQRIYPEDRQRVIDVADRMIREGISSEVEHRIEWPDGSLHWILERGDVVRDARGRVMRLVGIVQDITHRKTIETALRESEERYRLLVELSPETIMVHRAGTILYMNSAGLQLFGTQTDDQLIGRHLLTFAYPDDYPMIAKLLECQGRGEYVKASEQRLVRENGGIVYTESVSGPIMYEGELATLAILRDVTDRKAAEAALRASEERHRIMLETMPDLIFVMNGDGVYLDIKESAAVSLARPKDELIGCNVREVLSPREAEESLQRLRRTLETGGVQTSQFALTIRGEEHYFETRMVKSGENEVLSVVSDITDRRDAEQRALELTLERERVQLLTSFITNASHEFRTPLSIIGLKAYLLHADKGTEKRDTYIKDIVEQIESLSTLIDGLLVMVRIDSQSSLTLKPMNLVLFLSSVCANVNDQAKSAGLTLTCDIDEMLPPYPGHMAYLQRAFENLLYNAVRYTPPGGKIHLQAVHEDGAVVVTITDTGIGITPEQSQRIFERFYRGDEAHSTRGFGLGLPIARVIFERHGGAIEHESTPGQGTTFRVILPV